MPQALGAARADAAGLGVNVGALFPGGHGVQHHQARIVDPAIGVFETLGDLAFQRAVGAELQAFRTLELFALAQVVIEKQPGADHPCRAQVRAVG
ncbi:hypothetical protein D3C85_1412960 [compost metagenome]